jgi:hypothetical protein
MVKQYVSKVALFSPSPLHLHCSRLNKVLSGTAQMPPM